MSNRNVSFHYQQQQTDTTSREVQTDDEETMIRRIAANSAASVQLAQNFAAKLFLKLVEVILKERNLCGMRFTPTGKLTLLWFLYLITSINYIQLFNHIVPPYYMAVMCAYTPGFYHKQFPLRKSDFLKLCGDQYLISGIHRYSKFVINAYSYFFQGPATNEIRAKVKKMDPDTAIHGIIAGVAMVSVIEIMIFFTVIGIVCLVLLFSASCSCSKVSCCFKRRHSFNVPYQRQSKSKVQSGKQFSEASENHQPSQIEVGSSTHPSKSGKGGSHLFHEVYNLAPAGSVSEQTIVAQVSESKQASRKSDSSENHISEFIFEGTLTQEVSKQPPNLLIERPAPEQLILDKLPRVETRDSQIDTLKFQSDLNSASSLKQTASPFPSNSLHVRSMQFDMRVEPTSEVKTPTTKLGQLMECLTGSHSTEPKELEVRAASVSSTSPEYVGLFDSTLASPYNS